MDSREVENEIDVLAGEDKKLAEMMSELKRVEAPSNFEFGVRARIASGAPEQSASFIPFLKVAAPLALVLTVTLGVLLYGGTLTGDTPVVEQPGNEQPRSSNLSEFSFVPPEQRRAEPKVADPLSVAPQANQSTENEVASRGLDRKRDDRARRPRSSANTTPDGTSTDIGVHGAKVITQPGMSGDVSLKEAFQVIGISGDFSAKGWTVSSCTGGSLANRSGIRAGDVVESIDGLGVSEKTVIKGPLSIKSVRIIRDGKPLDVKLAN